MAKKGAAPKAAPGQEKPHKRRFIAEHEVHPFLIARLVRIEWPEIVEVNIHQNKWVDIEGVGYLTRIGVDEERKYIRLTGYIPIADTSASAAARQALCNRIMQDLPAVRCIFDPSNPDTLIAGYDLPFDGGISKDALLNVIGVVAIAVPMSLNYQDHDKLTRWHNWY